MHSTPEIIKLVEELGKFWRVTFTAGAKTILKSVHSLLQNKCFLCNLVIVRKQKKKRQPMIDASYSSPCFSILRSQNYFLYDKSFLHNSSTIVKLYLSHLLLQSCNNNIRVVYVPRKSIKRIKMWMPHILAEYLNKNTFIPLQFKLIYTRFKHTSSANAVHPLITSFFLMCQRYSDLRQSF